MNTNRVRINTLAVAARLPVVSGFREFVEAAALMSYGPNIPDLLPGAPLTMLTRYYAERSRPICRLSSQPSSILSST